MYSYEWDKTTRGYKLRLQNEKFVACELRPVFAEELTLLGADSVLEYNHDEKAPLMWAKLNSLFYNGEECGKILFDEEHKLTFALSKDVKLKKLLPVDIEKMLQVNKHIMDALVTDTVKRIKEMYNLYKSKCKMVYIGFSGGKDSMVLLDLCHRVLPLNIPVVFSDTDMELPDTYLTWEKVKTMYPDRKFIMVRSDHSALSNWELFGPPSQNLRWCCSVHKSTPAVLYLSHQGLAYTAKTQAFVGVRADESQRRSKYEDVSDGLKNSNQVNSMPILAWGSHELYLYIFSEGLFINPAYRKGLPRVGCLWCPMSNEKQCWLIRKLYPIASKVFFDAIKHSVDRDFSSDGDFDRYVMEGGWHARQSGVSLKNVITYPTEIIVNGIVQLKFNPVKVATLIEWLKTIGNFAVDEKSKEFVINCNGSEYRLFFEGEGDFIIGLRWQVNSEKNGKATTKYIKNAVHKALSCVGCRVCEAECPTGALSFKHGLHLDSAKCIHCMRCHSAQEGCLRFFSLRYSGGNTMNISGINKYMSFGLRLEWLETLAVEGENFRSTTVLGNRMIPSAVNWFKEANLITDSKSIKTTRLFDLAKRDGFDNEKLWQMIWISLSNRSPLVKWFICNFEIDKRYTQTELKEKLSLDVKSESVVKGASQSLFSLLKSTPLGSDSGVVRLGVRGAVVTDVTRVRRSISALSALYSLYLIGQVSDRTSFTLSEMMHTDFSSAYISPLVAFGISVEEFKGQCLALASKYPSFISCSFTLGLDEIKIYPSEKSLDDVLDLVLE